MCSFPKLNNHKGQHTIEYILLLTLIMAGIIIGGRYVYRSWNANLKGWEDSAVDSVQDPLLRDDDQPTTDCSPLPWERLGCGVGASGCGGPSGCAETFMTEYQRYEPFDCNCGLNPPAPSVRCVADDCCCTQPTKTGRCGANVTFVTGRSKPECATNVQMAPKNFDGTCPPGTMEAWVRCGYDDDPADYRYGCVPDAGCENACFGPPSVSSGPEYGPICPGDDLQLPIDTRNMFVNFGACSPRKCEYQCAPGFYAFDFGQYCAPCPTPGVVTSGCPAGTYNVGSCAIPQFQTCCYLAEPQSCAGTPAGTKYVTGFASATPQPPPPFSLSIPVGFGAHGQILDSVSCTGGPLCTPDESNCLSSGWSGNCALECNNGTWYMLGAHDNCPSCAVIQRKRIGPNPAPPQ